MSEPFSDTPEAGAGASTPAESAAPSERDDHDEESIEHGGSTAIPIGRPVDEQTFAELKRQAAVADTENQIPAQYEDE